MSAEGDGASLLGSDEPGTGCSCRSRRCWVIRIVSTALAVIAAVAVGILLPRYLHGRGGKAAPESSAYETSCSLWCSSPLLSAVELQAVFSDSKTFVDMPLWYNTSVEATLDAFKEWEGSLADFVHENFQPAGTGLEKAHLGDWQPSPPALALQNSTLRGWAHALHALWSDQFARQVSNDTLAHPSLGTLLPLPHTIVVPGGRFREVYYWDSYWILLGLLRGGLLDTSRALLANMAWQLEQFGFIPNGARTYYAASSAARSQPPMFSEMVVAVAQATNDKGILAAYAPAMGAELEYWLKEHTVKVGRHTLFRYTTTATQPRPESFREDAQHAQAAGFSSLAAAGSAGLFAEIAGAAETGWDFSSRWLHPAPEPGTFNFTNMHTSCVLPADLNSILYRYLLNVVYALDMLGDDAPALPRSRDAYADLAAQLATSIRQVLWQPGVGVWADAVNPAHEAAVPTCPAEVPDATALQLRRGTAAAFVGMWAGCGRRAPRGPSTAAVPCVWNTGNASEVGLTTATLVGGPLWQANGVMTSAVYTGQQWDAPCGWAPLQWWLHEGLLAGGQPQHARELARRWLATNLQGWQADGVMYEKYNVTGPPGHRCSGGEYTPQSGFGWTNGVALDFMVRYNFTTLAAMEFLNQIKQHELYQQFDAWAVETGEQILTLANPDLPAAQRATAGWPMTDFREMLAWVVVYGLIVFVGLLLYKKPKKAAKRGPMPWSEVFASFQSEPIKILQAVYNLVQVVLCGWMVFAAAKAAIDQDYNLVCNTFKPEGSDVTFVLYVFYLSKILDFFDTLFMVLRGKWAQFSFLHIYHHFSIFFVYWVNANVGYDGDIYYTIIANGFIHCVMYFYYLQTTFGAKPWWAKHLTSLQLLQFVTMMSQAVYMLTRPNVGCGFPRNVITFYFFYILSLFLLFAQFFVRRYMQGDSKGKNKVKKQ